MTNPALKIGGAAAECTVCGEVFNSAAGFDRHRVGQIDRDRRCLTVAEMIDRGMSKNARNLWITSAFDSEAKARQGAA